MSHKLSKLLILLLLVMAAMPAHAVQESRKYSSDNRIRTYVYNPDEVYVFRGHYRYQSSIEFAQDEVIANISIGDSVGWQIVPSGSRIFLKPVDQDATTNMSVITNKRIYHFELYADEAEDIRDSELVFSVRFTYPQEQSASEAGFMQYQASGYGDDIPNLSNDPQRFNFNYTTTGSERISPLRIFDDGEFTYVQFRGVNADIPAVFMVHPSGKESLVNFRTQGDYIVIERVASQYTLRLGDETACIYNESNPLKVEERKQRSQPSTTRMQMKSRGR